MKYKSLLTLTLLLVMVTSTTATSISLDQTPSLIIRERVHTSDGFVMKGVGIEAENTSSFELLVSGIQNRRTFTKITGDPAITFGNDTITTVGEATLNYTIKSKNTLNVFQRDDYLKRFPVNERYKNTTLDFNTDTKILDINRTTNIPFNFDELDSNENVTRKDFVDRDITLFIKKWGYTYSVPVNNTEGEIIGRVFGFRLNIEFILYDSTTKELVAYHISRNSGLGNMLPSFINDYLANQPLLNRITQKIIDGRNGTTPGDLRRIYWLDLGYNSTYDLDMYLGVYRLKHIGSTIIVPRTSITTLGLNSVTDIESVLDQALSEQDMPGFDDDSVDIVEEEALNAALYDENISLDDIFNIDNSEKKTPFNYLAFIIGMIAILPIKRAINKKI